MSHSGTSKKHCKYFRLDGKKCVYLSQSVPVCDGLPWVSQHFIPVISSETLSVGPSVTHTDHLIVSNPVSLKHTFVHTWIHVVKLIVVLGMTHQSVTQ